MKTTYEQMKVRNGQGAETELLENVIWKRANGPTETTASVSLLEAMRPTLLVCLGGSGHQTGLHLKARMNERFGQVWREKIRLLAFDTTEEPFALQAGEDILRLEPDSEMHNTGNIPVPNIMQNLDKLGVIGERVGPVMSKLPANSMRHGAKQIRPLALLAFLWRYPVILEQLTKAVWHLAGRDLVEGGSTRQQGVNVFIFGSLAGGTCSGMFLDTAYLIRDLFNELGAQGQFCHITGIGFLPQAFYGIPAQYLHANTGAALEELNHAMVNGRFQARYPDGRVVDVPDAPFNLFYVIDGVDENGQTWSNIGEVTAMAAEGIFLQMASQLGRKGENAFDNADSILSGRTDDGQCKFLASFGPGYLEFPAPAVADLCSRWFLVTQIRDVWLRPAADRTDHDTVDRVEGMNPVQLAQQLRRDQEGVGELAVDLQLPGWLADKKADDVPAEAAHYARAYRQARLEEVLLKQVRANSQAVAQVQQLTWQKWLAAALFTPEYSVSHLLAVLRQSQTQLTSWIETTRAALSDIDAQVERQVADMMRREEVLIEASNSLFIVRGSKVKEALNRYFRVAHALYETEFDRGCWQGALYIWQDLMLHLAGWERLLQGLAERLETLAAQTAVDAANQMEQLAMGGVARLSLADEAYVRQVYQHYAPEHVNVAALVAGDNPADENDGADLLAWAQLPTRELGDRLLRVLREKFVPVTDLTIERVIQERSQEMSPRARRQQLFRLATPSWSINQARLPEGGNELVRLEVLGVADETNTLFHDESMLVSTHDPYQLVALVVVAGAPPSALQQYDFYRRQLEQVRGQRPMYVLPHFIAEEDQAGLAFALGNIFGLITSQAAYFYYQPADPLQSSIQLGNGLAKAIEGVASHNGLAREIVERVDGRIAQLGLQQAIEVLASYYNTVPNGRSSTDEISRSLKTRVRAYANELRQVSDFTTGLR